MNFGEPPLTVELVPRTCWFSNVRDHVPREVWDRLRREVYKQAGHRCEVCGGRGSRHPVECHEVWHYDDAALVQRLEGLVALCPACHEVKHLGFASARGRLEPALRHMATVNGWSPEDAGLCAEGVFELWARRSNREWRLDLSWLRERGVEVREKRPTGLDAARPPVL